MLKMRAVSAVGSYAGPLVIEDPGSGTAGVHHGLDRQHHTFAQARSVPARTVVRHLRFLVQAGSDAVSDKFADHAEAVGLDKFLYRGANVSYCVADPRRLDSPV